ncbi:hypothetical protein ECANGB1_1940 [Enterospora canceri]|uniref:Uncharacterized protein n=1 Tax=Enterospora canceri TaxID=1081671 RepID=A0A1Y1S5D1_9MICR|nr:hypothetical protein ECANGB1_1940 [Enterospora canceri]
MLFYIFHTVYSISIEPIFVDGILSKIDLAFPYDTVITDIHLIVEEKIEKVIPLEKVLIKNHYPCRLAEKLCKEINGYKDYAKAFCLLKTAEHEKRAKFIKVLCKIAAKQNLEEASEEIATWLLHKQFELLISEFGVKQTTSFSLKAKLYKCDSINDYRYLETELYKLKPQEKPIEANTKPIVIDARPEQKKFIFIEHISDFKSVDEYIERKKKQKRYRISRMKQPTKRGLESFLDRNIFNLKDEIDIRRYLLIAIMVLTCINMLLIYICTRKTNK